MAQALSAPIEFATVVDYNPTTTGPAGSANGTPRDDVRSSDDRDAITSSPSADAVRLSPRMAPTIVLEKAHLSPSVKSVHYASSVDEKATLQPTLPGPALPTTKHGLAVAVPEKKLHWVSRKMMLGCLVLGALTAIGHHLWYWSRDRRPVGDQFEQQRTRLLGNVFPYLVQTCLLVSVDIAFTQYLFMCLRKRPVTVRVLDAAYSAASSLVFLFNWGMLKALPDVAAVAIVLAMLTVPTTMVTPGTLTVIQDLASVTSIAPVNQLNISSTDVHQANFFHVSRDANGPGDPDNSTVIFVAPRTILSRLANAAAASGSILASSAPAVNASYQLEFYGPYVSCGTANVTEEAAIDRAMNLTIESLEQEGLTHQYTAYYSYVPDLSTRDSSLWALPTNRSFNASQSSNELWLFFRRNSTAYTTNPFPQCPETVYQTCNLYNASYDLTVTFNNSLMSIIHNTPNATPLPINRIPFPAPTSNLTSSPHLIPQLAYTAYMWVLTDLLTGTMGLYTEPAAYANDTISQAPFGAILSDIENTALLGSSDLDCYFALDWYLANKTWAPDSPQRALDVAFARNASLPDLIAELSANITLSLMSDELLAPTVETEVLVTSLLAVYDYKPATLLSAYGAALFAALIANVLGLVAFQKNRARMDKSFSFTASATQHTGLVDEVHHGRKGSIPTPKEVLDKNLQFRELGGGSGGWGFVVV